MKTGLSKAGSRRGAKPGDGSFNLGDQASADRGSTGHRHQCDRCVSSLRCVMMIVRPDQDFQDLFRLASLREVHFKRALANIASLTYLM